MRSMVVSPLLVLVIAAAAPSDIQPDVRGEMMRHLGFSTRGLLDLEGGNVVRYSSSTGVPGEIAVAGGVRVHASKEQFVDRVRDIVQFKRGREVLQIGRFSNPPRLQDLASLTVDKNDFDVRTCRVGACDVRLPMGTIQRFQNEINRSAPDIQKRTETLFKQVLLDHVIAYKNGETRGRITKYDDGPKPIRPGDEFEGVL